MCPYRWCISTRTTYLVTVDQVIYSASQPRIIDFFTFMSWIKFMLSCVEHEKFYNLKACFDVIFVKYYKWARIWQKVPYGCDNQNLAYGKSVKYYLFRAFPENLKLLPFILTNIWRLEATNQKMVRNVTSRWTLTLIWRQSCWSPVACWLFLAQYKHLFF